MKAHIKNVRISPKKLNLVAKMIRGKNASEAMDILRFTNKKAADILYKALGSAVANAENNGGLSRDQLTLDRLVVTKGIVMKRINPVSRGRAHRILKRSSHVNISLKSI
jgi:large subunit ribosomal protein L22